MLTETQITLRVLFISDSMNKTDDLLNKLKEAGYNARGSHIDDIEQLYSQLDEFNHWDLIVADDSISAITSEQLIKSTSERNLYIPIILITANKQQAPYHLLRNSMLKVIIDSSDTAYFADVAIKEINDANLRKNNLLMGLALNSIETHSRNFLSQQNYAIIYTINGIICEVDDSFIKLCNIEDKNIIINKPIESLIEKEDIDTFVDFIQNIESATESISILQVSININNSSIPVSIIVRPTSLNGKFSLCFQIKKITKKPNNKLKPTNKSINKAKNINKIVDYETFQQHFNLALQKALSKNTYSMLCCINLGSLCKTIKNLAEANYENILNNIAVKIKESSVDNLILTNSENGYFFLLFNNIDKTNSEKIIKNVINKLDNEEIVLENDNNIKISAFAGIAMISSDADNPEDLISRVKQESVVAYINKMKTPNLCLPNNESATNSADKKILNTIKEDIKNKQIDIYYQGILNTKKNNFGIYDCFTLITTDKGAIRDNDLALKFSSLDLWDNLNKLKIITSIKEIKDNASKISSIIISIGINSLKNNDFLEWLDDFIMQKKVDSSYFIIEIHEYFAIKYIEETKNLFYKLRNKGYRSCISNFGCSMNYKKIITYLEPNFIRLDNTFIDNLDNNSLTDIKNILNAVKNFNTKVIAANINNINLMQKILQSDIFLLTGSYIQNKSQNIQSDF